MKVFAKDGRTIGDLLRGRENNFDFMRIMLAEFVIISHSYPLLFGDNRLELLYRVTGGQRTLGETAVDGFFIMSGFLIAASWERSSSLLEYLSKRVLRIYPGFLVAVAFTILIVGPLYAWRNSTPDYWDKLQPARLIVDSLNLDFPMPHASLNGSLWSIRFEFFCYLGVAFMGIVGLLRCSVFALLISLGCTAIYLAQLHFGLEMPGSRLTWLWCYPKIWPRLAASYLAGVFFYLYRDRCVCSWRWAAAASTLIIAAALVPSLQALPLIMPWCWGYLLFYFAFVADAGLYHFARYGDFSYGLYLYAFPVQLLIVQNMSKGLKELGPDLSALFVTVTATVVTAALAVLSWKFVESPFLARKRKLIIECEQPRESA